MLRRWRAAAVVLALGFTGSAAAALPVVFYSASALGGGLFRYDLVLDDTGGAEGLRGLDILHANSVFGLGSSPTVGTPSGWSYFAPLPPLLDDLDWFSQTPASDVPVGSSRAGFSFVSARDPSTLGGEDFAVEGIGATSASQIDLGVAEQVPEPGLLVLLAAAGLVRRRRAAL